MATVTGPLFSISASGTVGKSFTFGNWKGIQWTRRWFKPSNPQSVDQMIVRNRMSKAIASYKVELAPVKLFWDTSAIGKKMSGANLYTQQYALFMKNHAEVEPTNTDVNPMT